MTNIKAILKRMVETQESYGHYKASVKSLEEKYIMYKPQTYYNDEDDSYTWRKESNFYNKSGDNVANAVTYSNDVHSIWAQSGEMLGRNYITKAGKDKFDYIELNGYTIEDSNGNGYVDKNDKIIDKPQCYFETEGIDAPTIDQFLNEK